MRSDKQPGEIMSESYRIAVTTQNRRSITTHAGRCRRFRIYQITDGQIAGREEREVDQGETFHATDGLSIPPRLQDVQVVISGSMGPRMIQRLEANGVTGLVTDEVDPEQAIAAYLGGTLRVLPPEDHHHHHDSDHHHDPQEEAD